RHTRSAGERRQRVMRAVERVLAHHRIGGNGSRHLAAAFLLGLARAAIFEHAPEDRPEAIAARVVHLYLHGIGAPAAMPRLREAEASLAKAAGDATRAEPLRAGGVISTQEYEQVRTALDVARARRDQLRIQLEHTEIRAPMDGSVAARLVDAGNYVRAGTVLFRIVQDDPLKFRGEIPERDVPALRPGQGVRVSVDAFPGETFTGQVSRIGSAADAAARSLAFEALVPNADHRIRPGFFGHGEVVVSRDERALAVPRAALTSYA